MNKNMKRILLLSIVVFASKLVEAIVPTLELTLIEPDEKTHIYGSEAIFGRAFPPYATNLKRYEVVSYVDDYMYGCEVPKNTSLPENSILLVSRGGGCEFLRKAQLAEEVNAAALIIYESIANMYTTLDENGDFELKDPCNLDCASGVGSVPVDDARDYTKAIGGYPAQCGSDCPSQLCALTGETFFEDDENQVEKAGLCCIPNDYLILGGTWDEIYEAKVKIPTAWVAVSDGVNLRSKLTEEVENNTIVRNQDLKITASYRQIPRVDVPSLVLWHLAIFTVIFATYRAAQDMRIPLKIALYKYYGYPTQSLQAEHQFVIAQTDNMVVQEVQHINYRHAIGFVCFASAILIVLFLLVQANINVVYIMMVPFALCSVVALAHVVFLPFAYKTFPTWRNKPLIRLPYVGTIMLANAVVYPICIMIVLIWFFTRHSPGSFLIHNALGVLVCTFFLIQVKLTSLRTCAMIMFMFFIYDIIMVFFTPLITGGRSVMLDVATAGNLSPPDTDLSWDCYCRENPNDSRSCGPGEIMPMLFFFPRINDWRGGQAMLGFGDIIIPGVLLAYLLRWEYLYLLGVTGAPRVRPNVSHPTDPDVQPDTEEPVDNVSDTGEIYESVDNNPSVTDNDDGTPIVDNESLVQDNTTLRIYNPDNQHSERETDRFLPDSQNSPSPYGSPFASQGMVSFNRSKKYPLPSGWSIGLPFLHLSHEPSRIGDVYQAVRGGGPSPHGTAQQHASLLHEQDNDTIDSTVLPVEDINHEEQVNGSPPSLYGSPSAHVPGVPGSSTASSYSLDTTRTPLSLWLYGLLGYTIGLVIAMLAVSITGMGQPALLYIVPATLIAVHNRARQGGVWFDVWFGIYNIDEEEEEENVHV